MVRLCTERAEQPAEVLDRWSQRELSKASMPAEGHHLFSRQPLAPASPRTREVLHELCSFQSEISSIVCGTLSRIEAMLSPTLREAGEAEEIVWRTSHMDSGLCEEQQHLQQQQQHQKEHQQQQHPEKQSEQQDQPKRPKRPKQQQRQQQHQQQQQQQLLRQEQWAQQHQQDVSLTRSSLDNPNFKDEVLDDAAMNGHMEHSMSRPSGNSDVGCMNSGTQLRRLSDRPSTVLAVEEASKLISAEISTERMGRHSSVAVSRIKYRKKKSVPVPTGRLAWIAGHPLFDAVIVCVCVINAVVLGLQIDAQASGDSAHPVLIYIEISCTAVFVVELWIRILGLRWLLLTGEHLSWTIFDCTVLAMSLGDLFLNGPVSLRAVEVRDSNENGFVDQAASAGTFLKILRAGRILRVFRWVRFLTKLRVMMAMIVNSMRALLWLFVLLIAVIYGFSIILMHGAAQSQHMGKDAKLSKDIERFFGSLLITMNTLFISVTGGISWGEPADVAVRFGPHYLVTFMFYICLVFFSVLNIVTGVFVEIAMEQARSDREMRKMQAAESWKNYAHLLTDLLKATDTNGDGQISLEEWLESVQHESVGFLLEMLEVNETDLMELFEMLDVDKDRTVCLGELVHGVKKLRGNARSVDVHVLKMKLDTLEKRLLG